MLSAASTCFLIKINREVRFKARNVLLMNFCSCISLSGVLILVQFRVPHPLFGNFYFNNGTSLKDTCF